MVTFSGKSVLKGVAIGKLYIFKKQEYTMVKKSVEDVEAEVARFHGARLKGMEQLLISAKDISLAVTTRLAPSSFIYAAPSQPATVIWVLV